MTTMDLEAVWARREDEIYPRLFGGPGRGIFPLSQELFARQFSQPDPDPRWLFCGVFEFPPTETRASWVYVTSGYSNPWDAEPEQYDPESLSGGGLEMVLQTSEQGDWAVRALQSMFAYDLLLSAGRLPGQAPLSIGDRIPLGVSIDGRDGGQVSNLLAVAPEGVAGGFQLPSGRVRFLAFTGVTDAEREFARANGSEALVERLRAAGAHPVTDPRRASVV